MPQLGAGANAYFIVGGGKHCDFRYTARAHLDELLFRTNPVECLSTNGHGLTERSVRPTRAANFVELGQCDPTGSGGRDIDGRNADVFEHVS